jgi:integrase/recombinase XerD
MAGKQAKVLADDHIDELLTFARSSRYPSRNRIIVLLSVKAGLRAGEIAKLTWEMLLDPAGNVGTTIDLLDAAAKKGSGRRIPLHKDLRSALTHWRKQTAPFGPIVPSERGGHMRPLSIVMWFGRAYRAVGLTGCSSHSGRRTFITRAARLVHKAGGSLRDVQLLAGHRSIQTTLFASGSFGTSTRARGRALISPFVPDRARVEQTLIEKALKIDRLARLLKRPDDQDYPFG